MSHSGIGKSATWLLGLAVLGLVVMSGPVLAKKEDNPGGGTPGDVDALETRMDDVESVNDQQGQDITSLEGVSSVQAGEIANLISRAIGADLERATLRVRADQKDTQVNTLISDLSGLTAKMTAVESDIEAMETENDTQQTEIGDVLTDIVNIKSNLQFQLAVNLNQRNQLTSLRNVVRATRKLLKAQVAATKAAERKRAADLLFLQINNGTGPELLPYALWKSWLDRASDMAESARCRVVDIDASSEDCVLSSGEVIPVQEIDALVLSDNDLAATEEFVQVIEEAVDVQQPLFWAEVVTAVEDPSYDKANGLCDEYLADPTVLRWQTACLAELGLRESSEIAELIQSTTETTDETITVVLGNDQPVELVTNTCENTAILVEAEVSCPEEDASQLTDEWESIQIKGEKEIGSTGECTVWQWLFTGNVVLTDDNGAYCGQ